MGCPFHEKENGTCATWCETVPSGLWGKFPVCLGCVPGVDSGGACMPYCSALPKECHKWKPDCGKCPEFVGVRGLPCPGFPMTPALSEDTAAAADAARPSDTAVVEATAAQWCLVARSVTLSARRSLR